MQATSTSRLEIPESLRRKILAFRRRVWTIKLIEAVAGAVVGIFVGYLLTYLLDRFIDTPQLVRWALFSGAVLACGLVPWALDRWVWRQRRLDQLARLLSRKHPSVGDQLLGIIELAENESEQARSPQLVEAAIRQVSEVAERRDFSDAVPNPRHGRRSLVATLLVGSAAALLVLTTAAATNAWSRFSQPWAATPRYTFAAIEPLPKQIVVPHGEEFPLVVTLASGSEWQPAEAEVQLGNQPPIVAKLEAGTYRFTLPSQISSDTLRIRVGDYLGTTIIEPMHRPELNALNAAVTLPAYLERTEPLAREIRGGAMSVVAGSEAQFTATASRDLAAATVDQQPRQPEGPQFSSAAVPVTEERSLQLEWRDLFGLSGLEPFQLTVQATPDEAPSLMCEGLLRAQVLLDTEVLAFKVRARDDFGVRKVGMEWRGINPAVANPVQGEAVIAAGSSVAEDLELGATFSATQLKIEPQPIEMRVYVEDYLPGRERVYSPACTFYILNAEEHAIWVTDQLSRWHKMSLDVRDREKQLYATNQELRDLTPEAIDEPENRKRIEVQAAAERANGRRLSALVTSGEDLLKQAMRNPEIGVGHLERWAEMMQILKDISGNRMPSVADLLKEAAKAEQLAQASQSNDAPKAGQNLANISGSGDPKKPGEAKPPTQIPTISDVESTMNQPKPEPPKEPSESKPKQPRLTLPTTMLAGNGKAPPAKQPPAGEKVDEAVKVQKDLLAEFEKIADELNNILANLEGSTLVKRLKASSRKQQQVATTLGSVAAETFGASDRQKGGQEVTFIELANVETQSAQEVSNIMDDMAAYFDRSRFVRFKAVLDDMRKEDVTAGLRYLGDDLRRENGLSIAQAEYWSETLDRWAEDLVEVSKCGACPGCKAKGSLPPSIVLEVLQILEGEVKLREQTRVAQQAKAAVAADVHRETAEQLSDLQDGYRDRIDKVIVRILELPDAESDFAKELALLDQVSLVMDEGTGILARPETGPPAIAVETEAIELLLQSKRFNPNGGGGGGSSPGGGGGGTTNDSALALVGSGVNEKEVREDKGTAQETGTAGTVLPEEFRAGLDEYFNQLETQPK